MVCCADKGKDKAPASSAAQEANSDSDVSHLHLDVDDFVTAPEEPHHSSNVPHPDEEYHELEASEPPEDDPEALIAYLRRQIKTVTTVVKFLHGQADELREKNELCREKNAELESAMDRALDILKQIYRREQDFFTNCLFMEQGYRYRQNDARAKEEYARANQPLWRVLLGKEKKKEECETCKARDAACRWPDGGLNPFVKHADFFDMRDEDRNALIRAAKEGNILPWRELQQLVAVADNNLKTLAVEIEEVTRLVEEYRGVRRVLPPTPFTSL